MKIQQYRLNGEPCSIFSVETPEDFDVFENWLHDAMTKGPIGCDSETEGLETYGKDRLRMVQFGDAYTGWCIPVEDYKGNQYAGEFRARTVKAIKSIPFLVFHNASFDLQVFDRNLGLKMEEVWPKVQDTAILSHLIEPRGEDDNMIVFNKDTPEEYKRPHPDGPFGRKLEILVAKYISKEAAQEVKALMLKLAREYKVKKAEIYALIDVDHPEFNLYSGMDPVFAVRLFKILNPLVPSVSRNLIPYEHKISEVCSYMQRQGFERDEEYSRALSAKFEKDQKEAEFHADAFFGISSVNSPKQIVEELIEEWGMHGPKDCPGKDCNGLPHFTYTKNGAPQVNSDLLEALMGDSETPAVGSIAHLATSITEAKRFGKWRTSWVDKFIEGADESGRVHANFNTLQARTARMSITGIPAQTLPSSDWVVRRCFRADWGHRIASVDYDAQELRVLAALSQDANMIRAFAENLDLHQITADGAGVPRKVGKMANFLKVYGGGFAKLMRNAHVSEEVARRVIKSLAETYPEMIKYGRYLQRLAEDQGFVTTPTGRVLPVDSWRTYAALNYMVQSTSRDVTCRGLLALHDAGYTPFLRLVIHDEVLLSLPEEFAEYAAADVARLIGTEFRGVNVSASGEVGGRTWGSLYACNASRSCGLPAHDKGEHSPSEWAERWKEQLVAA